MSGTRRPAWAGTAPFSVGSAVTRYVIERDNSGWSLRCDRGEKSLHADKRAAIEAAVASYLSTQTKGDRSEIVVDEQADRPDR